MKAISLFSGMGGDSLGIKNCNFDLVAYSEKESVFRKTHEMNFQNCKLLGNGNIIDTKNEQLEKYKDVQLVFAGFPCQGFSNAGNKKENDPRNTLFREFLRVSEVIKPNYIIGENVKGLISRKTSNGDKYIDVITQEFENIGYNITTKVVKCTDYGIPQLRERLIIVGVKKHSVFKFPKVTKCDISLKEIVKFDMTGAIKIEPEDYDMKSIPEECILTDLTNDQGENNPHPNLRLIINKQDTTYKGKECSKLLFGKRTPIGGEIIDIRKPSKTIICSYNYCPRLFVPLRNKNGYFLRCLNISELKQIQGFPESYKINGNTSQQITQIGNAVPPLLVQKIIESLPDIKSNV